VSCETLADKKEKIRVKNSVNKRKKLKMDGYLCCINEQWRCAKKK
jgi:hypothetical protein